MKVIKSPYIFKIIISYINERRKLGLIKYNNKLQNLLNISLINYRLFSGKYISTAKDGNSKIYDYNDNLIFEGKYLNGKKHGKGKEYNIYGELLFEGEYLNGKKWNGKGYYVDTIFDKDDTRYKIKDNQREHNIDKSKIFYKIKEGKGYMVDYDDEESIYEGEYLKGERNGKGRDYKKFGNNLLIYDGEYLNGKRNGKGKEYQAKDVESAICGNCILTFEGEYLNGRKWNGKGYDGNNNIVYEIKNGKGFIKEYYGSELIFEGELLRGEINGKGKIYYSKNKLKFEGEYLDGKKHGEGKEYDETGNLIFQGKYLYNYKIKGKEYYNNDKLKYEGEYIFEQKWNGKGYDKKENIIYELINGNGTIKEYYNNGKLKLEGKYINGKGKVKIYTLNNKISFKGEYINGKKHGKGKEFDDKGNLAFEGEYLNGKRWNGKGKEFDYKGNFVFEGEYLNGKYNKGKELNILIHPIKMEGYIENFEGDYLNGKKWNGKNQLILINTCIRCNAKDSIIKENQYGELVCINCGLVIHLPNQAPNLLGMEFPIENQILNLNQVVFEVEYSNSKKNGKGKEYYFNGKIKFEGDYLDSLKWNGKEYDINNNVYEIKNGNGNIKEFDYYGKLIFEGEYLNGRKWNGKIYDNNDKIYNLKDGKGTIKEYKYFSKYKGKLIFEGEYLNGKRNGKAKKYIVINSSGQTFLKFDGEYLNGVKHGIGKEYSNGNLIFEGEYLNGKIMKIRAGEIKKNKNSI